MKPLNFIEEAARKKLAAPAGWAMSGWERVGDTNDLIVKGGIPYTVKSGTNKGRRSWQGVKLDRAAVTEAETRQAKLDYERDTGNCAVCQGSGKAWAGWDHIDGNRYEPCQRCGATGKAPLIAKEAS
ncbi:hypothetical protein PU634_04920 [Oceanimonas pelagia]|uniref:Uncharacterized protein n=1 Tax=Oceanimonas pelagia TaxID=3028314 RepID=A0AA50QD14_9GAMM|nr:hypothetical protein [Oceanimonas pelagia]WMC11709.1 hypothetical protein PU634_04920 [Oceanimonas pelagia]